MIRRSVLVIPLLLAAAGCGARHTAAEFVHRGDEQQAAGHFSAAAIEYRNAIKQEPARAEAHRKLADTYAAEGKLEQAYRAYANAIELDRNDVHSRVEAGRLLFGAGRFNEALVRAEQALERDDQSVDAQILAGRSLTRLRRFDEAMAQLEGTIAIERRPAAYAALADVKAATNDLAGAEAALRAGVAAQPSSVEARVALARFLAAGGRNADAEREFLQAVAASPTSEVANRAAASFYVSIDRSGAAEPFLKTAAAQPKQTLNSTLALADYYSAARRYADARAVLEPLASTSGTSAGAAKVRLAAIEFESGAPAAARRLLDGELKHPTAEALALNAQMLEREGKSDEALASAHGAIDLDPHAATAHYVIGSIELERGHFAEAERSFRDVLRENRLVPQTQLQLARTTLAAGRAREAIDLADAAGRSLDARLILARALIADRQSDRARVELTRIASEYPQAPEPAILQGSIELAAGDVARARDLATRALAMAPAQPDALMLAARAAVAANDAASAERYLTRAIEASPAAFEGHAMLAHLYATRGEFDRARTTLEQFAARHQNDAAPLVALGIVLEAAGQPADARARYEQALTLQPGEPVASNNLARLYVTDESRLGQAVDLARNAVAGMPNDAEAHDTLGWIAFRTGRLSLAASELERAVALNGNQASYRGHLQEVRQAIEAEKAAAAAAEAKKRAEPSRSVGL